MKGEVMKPDHVSIVEHLAFYGDTPAEALIKVVNWIDKNGFEFNSGNIITLTENVEEGDYIASFDADYRSDITFQEIVKKPIDNFQ